MKTRLLTGHDIPAAAAILREGGLLGIPTETVYGLGADGLNAEAVRHIFEAKGRPQDNPLILHIPDASWLSRYCHDVPASAYALAERFWPGPLTMILPRREIVPDAVTCGLDTVGVRCPDHPVTLEIIRAAAVPVAAPSGNRSGRPSPTIIDLTVAPPRLLRPGGLPLEELREVLGEITVDKAVLSPLAAGEKPRAPGMKYRHYAPKAPVTVVTGPGEGTARYIRERAGEHTGVICFDEFAEAFPNCVVEPIGSYADKAEQARRVFEALRAFDGTAVTAIYAQCPGDAGLGLAVANRLKKAAGFQIVDIGEDGI